MRSGPAHLRKRTQQSHWLVIGCNGVQVTSDGDEAPAKYPGRYSYEQLARQAGRAGLSHYLPLMTCPRISPVG